MLLKMMLSARMYGPRRWTTQKIRLCSSNVKITAATKLRPLLLLDVDGVINILHLGNPAWKDVKSLELEICTVNYSPTVVDWINSWGKRAEIRWLTMWDDDAPNQLAPALGLNSFELARDSASINKGDCALNWHLTNPSRPICWIDDEIKSYSSNPPDLWPKRNNTLFVGPNYMYGLTPKDVDEVNKFLDDPFHYGNNYQAMIEKKFLESKWTNDE